MSRQVRLQTYMSCETIGSSIKQPANSISWTLGTILRTVLRGAAVLLIRAYKRHRTDAALMRLNEYQLRDIGLERTHDGYTTRDWY